MHVVWSPQDMNHYLHLYILYGADVSMYFDAAPLSPRYIRIRNARINLKCFLLGLVSTTVKPEEFL